MSHSLIVVVIANLCYVMTMTYDSFLFWGHSGKNLDLDIKLKGTKKMVDFY